MKLSQQRPSAAIVVALLVLCCATLVLTTASATAASPGDPFLLGQNNQIDLTTGLKGTVDGPQLNVENASATGIGASLFGATGLLGTSTALNGIGVHGVSNNGPYASGVSGESATGAGMYGFSSGGTGQGVSGYSVAPGGVGVIGQAHTGTDARGVYGSSQSGTGVYGWHSSSSGSSAGVYGRTSSAAGAGVLGVNLAGGPGLQATVKTGFPPLKVNSTALVPNLNADRLDGYHAATLPFWKLGGNAGTTPGTHFLGTTDNVALELKVNGQRALRLEPTQSWSSTGEFVPNIIGGSSRNGAVAGIDGATIAGGGASSAADANVVTDFWGTIGGGDGNRAGQRATVVGGSRNTASGLASTVAGGSSNTASGDASFAAGSGAVADDNWSFVWSDGGFHSQNGDLVKVSSPRDNSFSAHAAGGFNFWTNDFGPTTGCWIAPGGGSINCSSSRHVKKDFAPVNRDTLLRRLDRVPVTTWSYRQEKAAVRHIGPMAQDFKRAFKVGEDDTSIAMVDADGVALAAIQGLYRQNQALERQNRALNARLTKLERLLRMQGSWAGSNVGDSGSG